MARSNRYQNTSLRRIALPLGGIGTGTISLGGRGDLRDWEVVNRPAKGFVPDNAFFVLRTRESGKAPVMRCLRVWYRPKITKAGVVRQYPTTACPDSAPVNFWWRTP
jgi:hypothetical protein